MSNRKINLQCIHATMAGIKFVDAGNRSAYEILCLLVNKEKKSKKKAGASRYTLQLSPFWRKTLKKVALGPEYCRLVEEKFFQQQASLEKQFPVAIENCTKCTMEGIPKSIPYLNYTSQDAPQYVLGRRDVLWYTCYYHCPLFITLDSPTWTLLLNDIFIYCATLGKGGSGDYPVRLVTSSDDFVFDDETIDKKYVISKLQGKSNDFVTTREICQIVTYWGFQLYQSRKHKTIFFFVKPKRAPPPDFDLIQFISIGEICIPVRAEQSSKLPKQVPDKILKKGDTFPNPPSSLSKKEISSLIKSEVNIPQGLFGVECDKNPAVVKVASLNIMPPVPKKKRKKRKERKRDY